MWVELIIAISEALLFLLLFPLAAMAVTLWMYPLVGLTLERAPVSAYIASLSGPYSIVYCTWRTLTSRFGRDQAIWKSHQTWRIGLNIVSPYKLGTTSEIIRSASENQQYYTYI